MNKSNVPSNDEDTNDSARVPRKGKFQKNEKNKDRNFVGTRNRRWRKTSLKEDHDERTTRGDRFCQYT